MVVLIDVKSLLVFLTRIFPENRQGAEMDVGAAKDLVSNLQQLYVEEEGQSRPAIIIIVVSGLILFSALSELDFGGMAKLGRVGCVVGNDSLD